MRFELGHYPWTVKEFERREVTFRYALAPGGGVPKYVLAIRAPVEFREAVSLEIEFRSWKMAVAIVAYREKREKTEYTLGDPTSADKKKYVHPVAAAILPCVPIVDREIAKTGECHTCGDLLEHYMGGDCFLCIAARKKLLKAIGRDV